MERARPSCVLLVSADEGRRMRVRGLLVRAQYRVEVAASQREALHYIAQDAELPWQGLDALVVDQWSLGPAARTLIRAVCNAGLGVRVVVMSASGAADDTIACLRAGAADYIALPADPRQFISTVARALATPPPPSPPPRAP